MKQLAPHIFPLALLLCLGSTTATAKLILGVLTEEPAPTVATLLAELQPGGERIDVKAYDNASRLLEDLQAGRVDLALLEDTGTAQPGIAMVAELYPSVLHILYREELTPGDLGALLRSGNIWSGATGGIGHRVAGALARDFSVPADQLRLLQDPWTVEPDILFMFGGILAPDALSRLDGFRLYSLDDPFTLMHGSVAEGVALRYPNLRPFTLPAQLYPSLSEKAALTLSVSTLLLARSNLDEQLIYALALAVDQLAPRIAAIYPLAGLPQLSHTQGQARAAPLHPGAQRYRDRDLPGFFERNFELLGFIISLIVTCGSLLLAWRRHRRQARKNRLDSYYQRLLTSRSELVGGVGMADAIATAVRSIQTEVLQLVIEERLDADAALLAFLSLSNQILTEAESGVPVQQAARVRVHQTPG